MRWFENPVRDFMAEHWDVFIENSFDINLSLWKKILLRTTSLKKGSGQKMNRCNCYHEEYNKPECWGTKERDGCSCGGDEIKCDFYPKKRAEAQARIVTKDFQIEKWIEELNGYDSDGYPKSRYKHAGCEVENKTVSSVYPYCPYCGKKVTHIKILKDYWVKYKIERLEKQGYICIT